MIIAKKIMLLSASTLVIGALQAQSSKTPNVVLIMMDDQGYADIGCYGAEGFTTPNIDKLAENGIRFLNFYTGSSLSTPSRASLMTGCYAPRVGLAKNLFPRDTIGISNQETTLPEIFKQKDYTTTCIGKWHLGHTSGALPTRHGFDEFFGLPYANDMKPLPLMYNDQVLELSPDQNLLTNRYTQKAVEFINKNKNNPFFLYLAHTMPHIPLGVSDKFRGKSKQGMYGDVIMEIDWSVGEVVSALKKNGIINNTLIIVTSDNGPWLLYGNHGGSAKPFSHGKGTYFEGGQRQFCIMSWPAKINKGRICHEICSNLDFLPTMADLIGVNKPTLTIDGISILPLILQQKEFQETHRYFYYIKDRKIQAVRTNKWKLMLPGTYPKAIVFGNNGIKGKSENVESNLSLFDLEQDPAELNNLLSQHPDVVKELLVAAEKFQKDLDNNSRKAGIY